MKKSLVGRLLPHGRYIKSIIYGGIDGIVTTFAVVAGGAGASLSPGTLLVLGVANLAADGFSMGFGDFISSRAENEYFTKEKDREIWLFEHNKEALRQELQDIYVQKGFDKQQAAELADLISINKSAVIDTVLSQRGISKSNGEPRIKCFYTFFSFLTFGALPMLTYIIPYFYPSLFAYEFQLACVLTGFTLFCLGAVKVKFTGKNWFFSGAEMILLGGVSATTAYLIGSFLSWLVVY